MLSRVVRRVVLGAESYSPEAKQFFARTFIVDRDQKRRIARLIDRLNAGGLWAKTDGLALLAQDSQANSLVDLKRAATFTIIGSPTFLAYEGWTGAASAAINTGFVPTTAGGALTQDSNHAGVYLRNSRTTDQLYIALGAHDSVVTTGANNFHILPRVATGVCIYQNMCADISNAFVGNTQGHWLMTRTASNVSRMDKNGAGLFNSVVASVEFAIGISLYLLALHASPDSVFASSLDQMAAAHWGGGLDAAESAEYSAAVNEYLTAIGKNVY